MSTETGTVTNRYVTVRTTGESTIYRQFYVNVIKYNGRENKFGKHGYLHKRSARRAAKALALRLDVSYRQDLEYSDEPHAFVAGATV